MNPVTDSTNGKLPQKTYINPEKIGAALRDLYDVTEMAMLPYILLGDAAKQLNDGVDGFTENLLKVNKLEWGMFEKNLTPEIKSLFRTWNFEPWEDKGFKYESNGVEVFVHVITRDYKFFHMPDMKYYGPDMFKIANPFNKYWPLRHMIK
jgi:hypothetical protein